MSVFLYNIQTSTDINIHFEMAFNFHIHLYNNTVIKKIRIKLEPSNRSNF